MVAKLAAAAYYQKMAAGYCSEWQPDSEYWNARRFDRNRKQCKRDLPSSINRPVSFLFLDDQLIVHKSVTMNVSRTSEITTLDLLTNYEDC